MTIHRWSPANLGDLAAIYNRQIARSVPHCYEISHERFAAAPDDKTGDDRKAVFRSELLLVAAEAGTVLGFAHLHVGEIAHGSRRLEGGFIHFLTYEVGHRAAGQQLVASCEDYCRELGVSTLRAFDGYLYRFHHLGFPLVSDRMGHIYGLFGKNGYRLANEGEIFLEYLDYSIGVPPLPDACAEVQVDLKKGLGRHPNITVTAYLQGEAIGSCVTLSAGDLSGASEAEDTIFVDGLGVSDSRQGRGWGRYLLSRALSEASKQGYRHTVISTAKQNYRAQLFYTNYGYRVTDTVYGFVKDLRT